MIGNIVDKVVFRNERGHGPAFWITTIVAELVLAFLATMIVMWFSRQREFRADSGGARLAGRMSMIGALEALRRSHTEPLPDKMAAFGIAGGIGQDKYESLGTLNASVDDTVIGTYDLNPAVNLSRSMTRTTPG